MEIVKIPIEQIKINPKNPKLHNDEAILKSVQTFGIRQPIIVTPDGKDNYQIVAGHGRLNAFSAIGQTDIPCIVWDETDENVINAYMVADNSTVIGGGWNDESLSELLRGFEDIDMDVFGFDEKDLNLLLASPDQFGEDFDLEDGDKAPFRQMTFTLSNKQADIVEDAIGVSKDQGEFESDENLNSNGNALARLCMKYLEVME